MIVSGHVGDQPFLLTVEPGIQSADGPGGAAVWTRLTAAAGIRVEVPTVGQLRVTRGDPASALAWLRLQRDIRLDLVHDAPVLATPVPEGAQS